MDLRPATALAAPSDAPEPSSPAPEPGALPFTQYRRHSRYHLVNIGPQHRAIMRLLLKRKSLLEIAHTLGMTQSQVSGITKSQIFVDEFAKLQRMADEHTIDSVVDTRRRIERITGKSMDVLERLMDDARSSPRLQADIAFDFLDRAGLKAVERREVVVDYTAAAVAAFERRKRMQAAAQLEERTVIIANAPSEMQQLVEPPAQQYTLQGFDAEPPASDEPTADES